MLLEKVFDKLPHSTVELSVHSDFTLREAYDFLEELYPGTDIGIQILDSGTGVLLIENPKIGAAGEDRVVRRLPKMRLFFNGKNEDAKRKE